MSRFLRSSSPSASSTRATSTLNPDNNELPSNNTSRASSIRKSSSQRESDTATDSDARPRTAPSNSKTTHTSTHEPPIPSVRIFSDTFNLKRLKEAYAHHGLRKSPTTPELQSHRNSAGDNNLRRSSSTTSQATSTSTSAKTNNNNNNNNSTSPQLPELNFDARASARRAPASRSSNGIDTAFGPPPSLVTRSVSYNSEVARRVQNPAAATFAQQQGKQYGLRSPTEDAFRHTSSSFDSSSPLENNTNLSSPVQSPTTPATPANQQLDAGMDRTSAYSDAQEYMEDGVSKYKGGVSPGLGATDTDGSTRSTEDLFLNLAQDSSPAPTRNSSHMEKSTGRANAQRASLPVSSAATRSRRESVGSHESGARSILPSIEPSYVSQRRASTASSTPVTRARLNQLPSSTPDNRFNMYRSRYASSVTPQSGRRPSVPESATAYSRPTPYRPSKLNQLASRDFDSVSMADSPLDHRTFALRNEHHADIAESVVSGAPSTVWDELQELKSRIQRMEMTDKMVTAGSSGSGERPKTATTATTPLTTMSSSPKHQFKSGRSPTDSVIGGPAAVNAYPTLHKALERCKDSLTPQLYRALETAVSDALEMALLTGNAGAQANNFSGAQSVVNGGLSFERQMKRKADTLVRNMQDLCITMTDFKAERPGSSSRPGTSNGQQPTLQQAPSLVNRANTARAVSRASSTEPTNSSDTSRAIPSRALERIEARRISLMEPGSASGNNSPREAPEGFNRNSLNLPASTDFTPPQQTISKLPRSGTSLLRSRRREGTEEPEDDTQSIRPVSRAATEIGVLQRKRQNRLSGSFAAGARTSREYTSNVPLPNSSPVAPMATTPITGTLRRLNGMSLKTESPRSTSLASSSLLRRAATEVERTPEPESPVTPLQQRESNADEDGGSNRRLLRRSLGLYTSGARGALGLGLGKRGERRSVATGD